MFRRCPFSLSPHAREEAHRQVSLGLPPSPTLPRSSLEGRGRIVRGAAEDQTRLIVRNGFECCPVSLHQWMLRGAEAPEMFLGADEHPAERNGGSGVAKFVERVAMQDVKPVAGFQHHKFAG